MQIKESPDKLAQDLQFSGTIVDSIEEEENEIIFDFEITPNRPDCLSAIGIAREIAAIYKRKLTIPNPFSRTEFASQLSEIGFEVSDKNLCPNYSLGIIGSVKVGKSPQWLVKRLASSGIRSINNIVDISNFVMVETGQPMHAFDYDKIKGKITLRASNAGETITTLDGVKRDLPQGAIVIEDSEKIIDLAGLMGGQNSEVDENTKTLLLHAPLYNPLAIRKAAQYLSLRSEASNRFEKNLDPNAHRYAFERATLLIHELAEGSLISEIKSIGYPVKPREIVFPLSLVPEVLGIELKNEEIKNILGGLEILVNNANDKSNKISLKIPSFRTDLQAPIDITEEIGRMYGYNKFPRKLPTGEIPPKFTNEIDFEIKLKQFLVLLGAKEIYSPSLTSATILEKADIRSENCLRVSNRLVIDYEYLRPTLLLGLIQATSVNAKDFQKFSLFELGRVFEKDVGNDGLPKQPKKIATILYNSNLTDAKGILGQFLERLNVGDPTIEITKSTPPFSEMEANISLDHKIIGKFGRVDKGVLKKFDISSETYAFELGIENLRSFARERQYSKSLKYPAVVENISLFTAVNTKFSDVREAIRKGAGRNFLDLKLVEDKIIEGKRSLLLKVEYFDETKTLQKTQITNIRENVLKALRDSGAKPRVSEN